MKKYKGLFSVWLPLFLLAALILGQSGFLSNSNDSKFYNRLIVQLDQKPISQWIAPKWGDNFYSQDPDSYIHDHLVGNLIFGAALARLGYPAEQALNLVQMLFQILSIFMLAAIVRFFIPDRAPNALFWSLQLMPISFTYGVRANHEQGMFLFLLIAIYGAIRMSRDWKWLALVVIGTQGVFLIKGASVVVVPPICGIAYLFAAEKFKDKRTAWAALGVTASFASIAISGYLYELAYQNAAGQPFFAEYWDTQIMGRSFNEESKFVAERKSSDIFILQKLKNIYYYANRGFFYSAPWSLLAVAVLLRYRKNVWTKARTILLPENRLYSIMILSSAVIIGVFSISDRTASRYIFPVFYLLATAWVSFLSLHSKYFQKIGDKINAWGVYRVAGVMWFCFFSVKMISYALKKGA